MSEYLTTESEISELSEFNDEYHELLCRNQNLQSEVEAVKKQMADKEFELETNINILAFENENLKQTIKSYDELIDFYKNSKEGERVNSASMARKSTSGNLIKTNLELIQKITELENKNFNLEQSEHNLRREIYSLNSSVNQLKFELEKKNRSDDGEEREKDSNNNNYDYSYNKSRKGSDSNSNNKKGDSLIDVNDIRELLQEIDDLKKENAEISERALNMLTEKELEILVLRGEMESIKNNYERELEKEKEKEKEKKYATDNTNSNNKLNSNLNYNSFPNECINTNNNDVDLDLHFAMPGDKQLYAKYNQLEDEYLTHKKDSAEKENLWEHERDRLNKYIIGLENSHRSIMNDFESEITKLKNEIFNLELEKGTLEKELIKDKSSIESEMVKYTKIIRSLEEEKEKSEHNSKNQINLLQTELKELDLSNKTLREQIHSIEKQSNDMKNEHLRKIESIQEKWKYDSSVKELEISKLKSKSESLEKEKEILKKECENNRRVNEKTKNEYKDLIDQLRKLKESHEEEKRIASDKIANLEKTHENEKFFLKNQISELKNNKVNNYNTGSNTSFSTNMNINVNLNSSNPDLTEENSNLLKSKIQVLENEVQKLNSLIKLKENKNANFFRLNGEMEMLRKEKAKIKTEMEDMKEMYEIQIKDLLMKVNLRAKDVPSAERRSSTKPGNFNSKQLLENMELEEKLERLKVENKFLSEQIEIVKREVDNVKAVKDSQIKKIKEDLEEAEKIAANAKVSMAQIMFEKDSEVMKYKRLCKKMKLRLNGVIVEKPDKEVYNSSSATPKKRSSFFANLFNK